MFEMLSDILLSLEAVSMIVWLSGLVLFVALMVSRHSHSRIQQLEKQLRQARNDFRALTTASIGVGGRVMELERRQRRMAEKQEQVDIYESANQPYEHAITMAKKGLDVDELVDVCGVSRNEAELIHMMHRLKAAS